MTVRWPLVPEQDQTHEKRIATYNASLSIQLSVAEESSSRMVEDVEEFWYEVRNREPII